MKKRFLLVFLFIFVIIFILIFVKNNYKKIQFGNNKNNKSVEKIEEYILNISSYKTTMEVTVTSNKNENKYLIKQEHNNDKNIQIIEEPETIKGVEIIENEGKVEVKNSNLNLSQIYNEYPYISENILWLNSYRLDGLKSLCLGNYIIYLAVVLRHVCQAVLLLMLKQQYFLNV